MGDRGEERGGIRPPLEGTAREPFTLQAGVRSHVKGVTTAPLTVQRGLREVVELKCSVS